MLVSAQAWSAIPEPPQDVQSGWLTRIGLPWNSFTPGNESLLRWALVASADTYNVYAYDEPTISWTLVASGSTNVHHRFFSPENLSDRYRVTAVNADGESAPSAECIVTPQLADFMIYIGMLPGISDFDSDITPTNAWLSWAVNVTSGADGLVELSSNGSDFTTAYLSTNYSGWHGLWLTNLTPFTLYTYRVTTIATNRGGYTLTNWFYTDDTNHAPTISDMSVSAADGYPAYITLSGTEYTLFEWDMIEEFRIISGPTNGTVSAMTLPAWDNSVMVIYTPNQNEDFVDHFWYVANDGDLDSAPALVTITHARNNYPPLAFNSQSIGDEDSIFATPLSAADSPSDTLTYVVLVPPAHGTLSGTAPDLSYAPAPGFHGTDSFVFIANDGELDSNPATVYLTINPVNDAPTMTVIAGLTGAIEDGFAVVEHTALMSASDAFDADGDPVAFRVEGIFAGQLFYGGQPVVPGTTVVWPGDALQWVPEPDSNGPGIQAFSIVAWDSTVPSATALPVLIEVVPVNDSPKINPVASIQILEDAGPQTFQLSGLSAGPSNEPQALSIVATSTAPALTGPLSIAYVSPATTGTVTFTPSANASGSTTIEVAVNDGESTTVLPVQIIVTPVNDAPGANPQTVTTSYNTPVNITLTGSDVEGGSLSFTTVTSPANGTLSGTGANRTFTPNLNWSGTTSFTFVANDGELNSAIATVTITVNAPTSVPSAPNSLVATAISRSRIDLSWTDTSNTETGFKIERSANGSTWSQIATVGPNVTTYASTGLSANKTYYYRVRAYNTLGNSPYSNTASARTLR